jgi:diguanylate cyclase (GGDEF)-like protein
MRILFFIIFTLSTFINAQVKKPTESVEVKNITLHTSNVNERSLEETSETKILNKAKSLRHKNQKASAKLATEAQELATKNNNRPVVAQAHTLLGKLSHKRKEINSAFDHFLQASLIYKNINDQQAYIMSSLDYVNLLVDEKRYAEAENDVDDLIFIAQQYEEKSENEYKEKHGKNWTIGSALYVKGNTYYQQNKYKRAITQFLNASEYFSAPGKITQKKLGETYKKIAQSYKRLQNIEQTSFYYIKALEQFTAIEDLRSMALVLNTLADTERSMDNLVSALDYSNRGLEIYRKIDEPLGKAKALMGAGIIYRHIGRYEKSLTYLLEAQSYFKEVNDTNRVADSSNQLGFIYTRLKQFDLARSFYQLTIDLPKDKIKAKTLASALREMAVIYLDYQDYDAAMEMAKQAFQIYQTLNDKYKGSTTARVIANIYRDNENVPKSISYYRESLLLATQSGNIESQIKAMTPLAWSLIDINIDEAAELLEQSLELSIQINNKKLTLYNYIKLRKVEKLRGNIVESLHYAEEEIKLNKIIQNEKDKNELILAKANLYSHKMEIELESLREKAKLDQLELAKKSHEIEIAKKTKIITDLELIKNQYANTILTLLLAGAGLLVIFIYRRFIVSKKQNRELDYLAARDPLTNCYNRRILIDKMDLDFEHPETLDEYCIVMADIDNFKDVNDTHGHNVGDAVICGVANTLQECVRQNDIVARFGGEEFCIILHNVPENQALHIAESMREKVESSRFNDIATTCSFGVTSINFKATSSAELISQADLALYKSKSLGRNRVTMWNDTLEKRK